MGRLVDARGRLHAILAFIVVLLILPAMAAAQGPAEEAAKERQAERARWLASAQARDERRRSRQLYEAVSTNERAFPRVLAARPWKGARRAGRADRVIENVSRTAALVDRGAEGRALAESIGPMSTADGEAIDLTLQNRSGAIAPVNDAGDLELSETATGQVRLGSAEIGMRPLGAETVSPVVDDASVTWANAGTDTDFVVLPRVAGFETFHMLRSPASSERFVLRFDLPAGATLRPAPDPAPPNTFAVMDGTTVLASVTAPMALDAQQREVPLTASVDGADLILEVPHRGLDVAYPVAVDPIVEDQQFWNGYCARDEAVRASVCEAVATG